MLVDMHIGMDTRSDGQKACVLLALAFGLTSVACNTYALRVG